MAEREEPDLDRVREAMRRHDERAEDDAPPEPPEPPERDEPPRHEDDGDED